MTLFAQTDMAVSKALQGPDYVMLAGYFVLMLGIGLYFYRFMRGIKVYFTGGNKIPWWLSGVSFYMSSFTPTPSWPIPACASSSAGWA